MSDDEGIQSALLELLKDLTNLSKDGETKEHSEHDFKKIELLSQQIPKLDAELFNIAKTTKNKHSLYLTQICGSDTNINKKVDFALYFISQSVIERGYRTGGMTFYDSANVIFDTYVRLHSELDKETDTHVASLGSILLDIAAEESESIKNSAQVVKDELKEKEKELLRSSEKIQEKLSTTEKEISNKIEEHTTNVAIQNAKIEEDIKRVQDMKSELNFLALGDAFTKFIDKKGKEKRSLFWCLLVTGMLIIAPPLFLIANNLFKFYPPTNNIVTAQVPIQNTSTENDVTITTVVSKEDQKATQSKLAKNNDTSPKITPTASQTPISNSTVNPTKVIPSTNNLVNSVLLYAPFTLLEIFFLFYFRIFLKQFNSVSAQLLQLDMRLSVCQFIEDYAKFKKDSESDNLDKFETLIFSNLMPSADQVPSTFDGMDQLANLLKSKS